MERSQAERRAFRRQLARQEAPQVLLWSAFTTFALTLLYAAAFPYKPVTLALHAAEVLIFLAGAWLARQPWLPDRLLPWVLVLCTWGIVGGFLLENLWEPSTIGMVFLIIIMVAFGSFVFDPVALVVAAVPMVVGTALVASSEHPQDGPRWAVVAISAILLGAMLRFLRLRAFDQLGDALAENAALAVVDPLTGLLNRRGVEDRLPSLRAMAPRVGGAVFLAIIDIDGLKRVNDAHGHAAGDAVIRAVADGLRRAMRGIDLIARWGGDEFLVLGAGEPVDAEEVIGRILASVREGGIDPSVWSGSVSIGVAGAGADFDFTALLSAADEAMYAHRRDRRHPA